MQKEDNFQFFGVFFNFFRGETWILSDNIQNSIAGIIRTIVICQRQFS